MYSISEKKSFIMKEDDFSLSRLNFIDIIASTKKTICQ